MESAEQEIKSRKEEIICLLPVEVLEMKDEFIINLPKIEDLPTLKILNGSTIQELVIKK